MDLYLATTNAGKLRDFAQALTPGYTFALLPGLAGMPVPDETASTFEGNARIKAEAYSLAAPGLYVLADDSGLEVDALGGAPGVRSARYADDLGFSGAPGEGHDERNNACLLQQMLDHPFGRAARYRCTLALALDGVTLQTADGEVEGQILSAARGRGGFGYDPFFLIPELNQTMAELNPATRQQHSHRARALGRMLARFSR